MGCQCRWWYRTTQSPVICRVYAEHSRHTLSEKQERKQVVRECSFLNFVSSFSMPAAEKISTGPLEEGPGPTELFCETGSLFPQRRNLTRVKECRDSVYHRQLERFVVNLQRWIAPLETIICHLPSGAFDDSTFCGAGPIAPPSSGLLKMYTTVADYVENTWPGDSRRGRQAEKHPTPDIRDPGTPCVSLRNLRESMPGVSLHAYAQFGIVIRATLLFFKYQVSSPFLVLSSPHSLFAQYCTELGNRNFRQALLSCFLLLQSIQIPATSQGAHSEGLADSAIVRQGP